MVIAGSRFAGGKLPVAQMRRWYLAGDSNETIGRRVGVSGGTVRRVLLETGVTMRSRREQVAFKDQRAGVRVPSCDELAAGYIGEGLTMAELAARHGVTETRMLSLLSRCGIDRRRSGIRPERAAAERAARVPPALADELIAMYRSGMSRNQTARRAGVHRQTVSEVLHRAGVEMRNRRKLPAVAEWAHRYVDGGETAVEIAASYSMQQHAVLSALAAAGIDRRPAIVRMPELADGDVAGCYVDEGLSLQATARRLGVSVPRVRAAVGRLGVLRTGFRPVAVDRRRFSRRHAAGATIAELGADFGLTQHQVSVTIRAFELPPRLPYARRPLPITDSELARLVSAGSSDADIAARYRVAEWAVRRRRRAAALRRSNRRPPPVSRARLQRQLDAGRSRADIAAAHRVGLATVTRWCGFYGLNIGRSRPTGDRDVHLDAAELRRRYVVDGWSTAQLAADIGVDSALVTFALHSHRIPVRHGTDTVVLLDALYADPDVVDVLDRHGIPVRRRAGRLARRFPRPAALEPGLVDELYRVVGLSTTHISLLTGHSTSNVLDVLRRHGVAARPGSRSPWFVRTFL